ncbi:MAG: DUF2935 domain-containing protein [Christensenellales bacterium]
MLSSKEFVTMSVDLNLFFLRIMKEHSMFLELGFTPRDRSIGAKAASLRMGFERLLSEAATLANGAVSRETLESRQVTTQYTLEAERLTAFYTGVSIDSAVTQYELMLEPVDCWEPAVMLVDAVESLNHNAYKLTAALAEFKEMLLRNIYACKMFTLNYPLLIDHILREARFYMNMLAMLSNGKSITRPEDLSNQEAFWNRIMAEHSKFIAGLLDPTEETLIDTARMFGKEFDLLTAEATEATRYTMDIAKVTADSLQETLKLRDFKAAGTKGILECKIKSIILPLLGDHVLREANHYLCVLGMCEGN